MQTKKIDPKTLDSIVKNNPEILKQLEEMQKLSPETQRRVTREDVKFFKSFSEAKDKLNLVSFHIVKETSEDFTTVIDANKVISQDIKGDWVLRVTGERDTVLFPIDILTNANSIKLTSDNSSGDSAYDASIVLKPLSVEIILFEGKEIKVATSIPANEFIKSSNKYVKKIKSLSNGQDEIQNVEFKIVIDGNVVSVSSTGLSQNNSLYIVPIIARQDVIDKAEKDIEESFEKNKDAIVEKFIDPSLSDTKKEKLKEAINTFLIENKKTSKAKLLFAFEKDIIPKFGENYFERNNEIIDELTLTGDIYPKYGEESVNPSKIKEVDIDEKGFPIFTPRDKANFRIIGINEEMFDMIITASEATKDDCINQIKIFEKELEELKSKGAEDAIVSVFEEGASDELYDLAEEYVKIKNSYDASVQFIDDTLTQLLSMKMTSYRVEKKLNDGEFQNVYMQTAIAILSKAFDDVLVVNDANGKEDVFEDKQKTIITRFFEVINGLYGSRNINKVVDSSYILNRKREVEKNTNNFDWKSDTSIAKIYENICIPIIGTKNIIPEGVSEKDENDIILKELERNFNFFTGIARAPIQLISKLFPIITDAVNGKDEKRSADFESHFRKIGFGEIIDDETLQEDAKEIVKLLENKLKSFDLNKSEARRQIEESFKFSENANKKSYKKLTQKFSALSQFTAWHDLIVFTDPISTGEGFVEEEVTKDNYAELSEKYNIVFRDLLSDGQDEVEAQVYFDNKAKPNPGEESRYAAFKKLDEDEIARLGRDRAIRVALNSALFTVLSRIIGYYEDAASEITEENKRKMTNEAMKETPRMFVSSISSFVSVLKVIELVDVSKISESEPLDLFKAIPSLESYSIGKDALEYCFKNIKTVEDLTKARKEYVKASLEFVKIALR